MPGPTDYTKRLWALANKSLVPDEAIAGLTNAIDQPTLDRTPWEARLQGFGAGALEGVADLVTPMNMATAAVPAGLGMMAGRAVGRVIPAMGSLGRLPAQAADSPGVAKAMAGLRQTQRSPRPYEVRGLTNKLQQRLNEIPTGGEEGFISPRAAGLAGGLAAGAAGGGALMGVTPWSDEGQDIQLPSPQGAAIDPRLQRPNMLRMIQDATEGLQRVRGLTR